MVSAPALPSAYSVRGACGVSSSNVAVPGCPEPNAEIEPISRNRCTPATAAAWATLAVPTRLTPTTVAGSAASRAAADVIAAAWIT